MTYIISEISNQWGGNLEVAEQMILQSKMYGASAVKVQLFGNDWKPERVNPETGKDYLSLSFSELKRLKQYADSVDIDFFASPLDEERLEWCVELQFPYIKIGNGVYKNRKEMVKKAVETGQPIIISLDSSEITNNEPPFAESNVKYLYTERIYPLLLENVSMPDFDTSFIEGYSDHAAGLSACFYALSRGATIIEKHFTLSKSWQKTGESAHYGAMDATELQELQACARDVRMLRSGNPILGY